MTPAALQQWRARLGWTAKQAAKELGLSQNGYAAYERGWAWVYDKGLRVQTPRKPPKWLEMVCERLEQLHTQAG